MGKWVFSRPHKICIKTVFWPAPPCLDISAKVIESGNRAVCAIAEAVDLHGILAMEVFVTQKIISFLMKLPRAHNSFHWTIEGKSNQPVSPISAHYTGLGAGDSSAKGEYVMENLLGEDLIAWPFMQMAQNGHLYGKPKPEMAAKWVM